MRHWIIKPMRLIPCIKHHQNIMQVNSCMYHLPATRSYMYSLFASSDDMIHAKHCMVPENKLSLLVKPTTFNIISG